MTDWIFTLLLNSELLGAVIVSYVVLYRVVLGTPKPKKKWYLSKGDWR